MMNQEPDTQFTALRQLLAEKRHEIPVDTEVNRFLIELHRRQRAQLLRQQEAGFFGRLGGYLTGLGQWAFSPLPYVAAGTCMVAMVVVMSPRHSTVTVVPQNGNVNSSAVLASVETAEHQKSWSSEHLVTLFSEGNQHLDADLGKLSENLNVPKLNLTEVAPRFVMANSRVDYDTQASF